MKKFYEHLSGLSKKEKKNRIHSIEEQEKEKEKEREQKDGGKQKSKARKIQEN